MPPSAVFVQVRFKIVERQVPANIPIKFAVDIAAGITDLSAPDLLAGFNVTCENRNTVGACYRCMHAVSRTRITIKNGVRIADEIFNAGVFQQRFNSWFVRAFRKPNTSRLSAEMFFVVCDSDLDLCSAR